MIIYYYLLEKKNQWKIYYRLKQNINLKFDIEPWKIFRKLLYPFFIWLRGNQLQEAIITIWIELCVKFCIYKLDPVAISIRGFIVFCVATCPLGEMTFLYYR